MHAKRTSSTGLMYSHRTSISDQRPQQSSTIDLGTHAPIEVIKRRRLAGSHLGHNVRDLHLVVVAAFIIFQETR